MNPRIKRPNEVRVNNTTVNKTNNEARVKNTRANKPNNEARVNNITVNKTKENVWESMDNTETSPGRKPPNPIKYNKDLLNELGILALSYRIEKNLNSLANHESITLGNRNLKLYHGIDSCNIVFANKEIQEMFDKLEKESSNTPTLPIIDLKNNEHKKVFNNLFQNNDAAYFITRDKVWLVKKTIGNKLSLEHLKFRNETFNVNKLLTLLGKSEYINFTFKDSGEKYILLYDKLKLIDKPIKVINSIVSNNVNTATEKQKESLEWLAKNKNITFNSKVFFGNTKRREEVFFPVAIDREINLDKLRQFISETDGINKEKDEIDQLVTQQALENSKSSFYLHPWTSDNHLPNSQFPSFKTYVTSVCMFGTNLKGEDVKHETKKSIIKHDVKFMLEELISCVVHEIETENPYQEIVFRDFEKQLKFIDACSSSTNKIHLICHLPYVDYMLFGIKLFLHGRMTLNALHSFIKLINNEKEHYEERLNSLVKKLQLEDKIELKIQSPFTPLLKILKIETPDSLAESLIKLGINIPPKYLIDTDSPEVLSKRLKLLGVSIEQYKKQPLLLAVKEGLRIPLDDLTNLNSDEELIKRFTSLGLNINDSEFTSEEERKIKGIQRETILVNECLKFLQNNNDIDKCIWKDLVSFFESFHETKFSHKESPIENLFALGNIFHLVKETYTENPDKVCSFLPITEKQIQNMYAAFHKHGKNREFYGTIFNINYLDTTLTYNETQQHNANQCDTNTKGLAFYFNYPHSRYLYESLCKYLPQAADPLYKLAKEGRTSVKTLALQAETYAQKNPHVMFNNMSKIATNGHLVRGFKKPEQTEQSVPTPGF